MARGKAVAGGQAIAGGKAIAIGMGWATGKAREEGQDAIQAGLHKGGPQWYRGGSHSQGEALARASAVAMAMATGEVPEAGATFPEEAHTWEIASIPGKLAYCRMSHPA
ncbi:hypothetical protein BS47DRAFT_1358842 [Hydnum rufescens UP504]|uniref:Uncharacterized protein n=1 Tax=Hydnum rufescens UP504 TaxID=1448309 RepID=A0A9P6DXJ4_9AGAM|nr:hypothetical protein BS47DRAFT_1358842 [Hydnum rufescens UP504]